MARPATAVHTHQRCPAGRSLRTISRTTSVTAHPAVITAVTSWSLASSGGGGSRSETPGLTGAGGCARTGPAAGAGPGSSPERPLTGTG
jgi:hypothetical protein